MGLRWEGWELALPESFQGRRAGQEGRAGKGDALKGPIEAEFCSTTRASGHRAPVRGQALHEGWRKGLIGVKSVPLQPQPEANHNPQPLAPGQVLVLTSATPQTYVVILINNFVKIEQLCTWEVHHLCLGK